MEITARERPHKSKKCRLLFLHAREMEGEHLFENIAAGKENFAEMGAPLAYFGDPRISSKETGEKIQNLFSDLIVEEVLELIK